MEPHKSLRGNSIVQRSHNLKTHALPACMRASSPPAVSHQISIVLEYMDGGSLADVLRKVRAQGPFPGGSDGPAGPVALPKAGLTLATATNRTSAAASCLQHS